MDEQLLAGPDGEPCLRFGAPVARGTLRALVAERQRQLAAAGLGEHGTVALRMPPSAEFVAVLLAAWRSGAQAVLLDHRLTTVEVDRAVDRLHPGCWSNSPTGGLRSGRSRTAGRPAPSTPWSSSVRARPGRPR
ncbi:hypothetical protein ACFQ2M_35995 [Kitasatospora saccharophila]|uniref:hypothetical protein n=1 Tax=Kitasatospora saccharophila TaxID=407973 RepID=UPI00363EF146